MNAPAVIVVLLAARQLGVSAQAVSVWHTRWQAGGEGLQSRRPSGPAPRLSDA